jgi:hypothetical protein
MVTSSLPAQKYIIFMAISFAINQGLKEQYDDSI